MRVFRPLLKHYPRLTTFETKNTHLIPLAATSLEADFEDAGLEIANDEGDFTIR